MFCFAEVNIITLDTIMAPNGEIRFGQDGCYYEFPATIFHFNSADDVKSAVYMYINITNARVSPAD